MPRYSNNYLTTTVTDAELESFFNLAVNSPEKFVDDEITNAQFASILRELQIFRSKKKEQTQMSLSKKLKSRLQSTDEIPPTSDGLIIPSLLAGFVLGIVIGFIAGKM